MFKLTEIAPSLEPPVAPTMSTASHSFTKIPNKLIYSSLTPSAKAVYALIQQRSDVTDGIAYFSEAGLARHTGLSPKTIRRALKLLRQSNVVCRKTRGGKRHPKARVGRASEYLVNPPEEWRLGKYSPKYDSVERVGGAT